MERLKDIKYLIAFNVIFIVVCIISCCVIINNKSKKCNCPKCEITNNEIINNNKDNSNTNEDDTEDDGSNYINIMENADFFRQFSCIEKKEKYCLIKNDDNLKVEIEINSDYNYVLVVNGNRFLPDAVEYHVAITDLQFLNDGYIYVQFGIQGLGPMDKAYILDFNGNVISKSTDIDYILNDGNYDRDAAYIKFENNKLLLSNTVFGDGGLGVICSNKKYNSGWWPEYNQNVYVIFNYEYVGNGKLSEVNRRYKTFSELLQEQYGVSTCEELNR